MRTFPLNRPRLLLIVQDAASACSALHSHRPLKDDLIAGLLGILGHASYILKVSTQTPMSDKALALLWKDSVLAVSKTMDDMIHEDLPWNAPPFHVALHVARSAKKLRIQL